jgi:hypothetical protein
LNDRSVGQRVRERHPNLDYIRAGAIEREQEIARTREVRIARRRVRDETRALVRPQPREGVSKT